MTRPRDDPPVAAIDDGLPTYLVAMWVQELQRDHDGACWYLVYDGGRPTIAGQFALAHSGKSIVTARDCWYLAGVARDTWRAWRSAGQFDLPEA